MTANPLPCLMLVDDEPSVLLALEKLLSKSFRVFSYSDPLQALQFLENENHDLALVLADESLPNMTGIEFLKKIRSKSPLCIRCLFSGKMSVEKLAEAINGSVIHRFFSKPWDNDKLTLHVLECLQTHELMKKATTDPLTGLLNQKGFREMLSIEFDRSRRHHRTLCLMMIDVDHLKLVNDSKGHLAGDLVLSEVAQTLTKTLRTIDVIARYGGDEFAVILPDTSLDDAKSVGERILALARHSLSIGIAKLHPTHTTLDQLIFAADQTLYKAKSRGRHCVEIMKENA